MATSSHKARLLVASSSLSSKVSSGSVSNTAKMLDVTTLADDAKRFIAGLLDETFTCEGFADADALGALISSFDLNVAFFGLPTPVTYAPLGLSLGSPATLLNAWRASIEEGSPVNGVNNFTFQAQADGPASASGFMLHDLTAETVDANHTSYDRGVTSTANGAIATLHTTAFSGLTNNIVTIEDSANNSAFSTIGTFTTSTSAGANFLTISGTVRRYIRCVTNVTGTGSVTYACAFAPL